MYGAAAAARGVGDDDGDAAAVQQPDAASPPARPRPESRLLQAALLPQFSQWLQDVNGAGGRRRHGSGGDDALPPPAAAAAEAETAEFGSAGASDDADADAAALPPPLNRPREAPGGGDDQNAADELHALLRRGHHSLPFAGLLLVYFAYQHATGLVVFFVGSVAMLGLDQRLRAQIALKDKASELRLLGIVAMCAVDLFALCCVDGDPNPLRHFARSYQRDATRDGVFWDVLWTIVVNDFVIRLWSVAVKAAVALVKVDKLRCLWRKRGGARGSPVASAAVAIGADAAADDTSADLESQSMLSPPRTPSTITFYRRKRKLYGIIEMVSIFARSILAAVPWLNYYQLCASKFVADSFAFAYILVKALILGSQGRQIVALVRSFVTLGLEFGVYVSHEDLVEAGSPDCSICYEEMHQPVKLSCSHMFCEECVMEWFDRERSCPLCRASMATSPRGGSQDDEGKPQFLDGSTSLFPQLF